MSFGNKIIVSKIIDGDTFETETGEKVRLIGINSPEITDIFGEEAKSHLTTLILGKTVELLTDSISNKTDRYNRLLRYVVIDNVDINKQMILDGYAFAYLKYNFERKEDYKNSQLISTKKNLGIWSGIKNEKNNEIKSTKNISNLSVYKYKSKYLYFLVVTILALIGIYYYYKK